MDATVPWLDTLGGAFQALRRDLDRIVSLHAEGAPVGRLRRLGHLFLPSLQCAAVYRLSHLLHRRGWHGLSAFVTRIGAVFTHAVIHPASVIGPGLIVPHSVGIYFCGTAGRDLTLLPISVVAPVSLPRLADPLPPDSPRLAAGVTVGASAVILGTVAIGDHVTIGVQIAVLKDVKAQAVLIAPRAFRIVEATSVGDAAAVERPFSTKPT